MAIIIQPPTSGSIGNVVHSRNRNGQYIRQRAMPTQPRTVPQQAQRARLGDNAAAWRSLTAPQQAAWIAFANSFTVVNSLGTSNHMTGAQAYVKVNTVNNLNGTASVSVPPALPAFLPVTTTGITATAGTQLLEVAGTAPATGTTYMFYVTPQKSAGVSFVNNWRYILTSSTPTTGQFVLTTAYTAVYGALIIGKKVFVKVVQCQAGMQDNGTVYSAVILT